ncbi:SDR family oxidoreductase [Virgibacillus sp. NKC19-16]|uniref:SDR family NAD(P)-dependent oxidoreductase n=1 Tax=Virgibacillus salidurans TaxID=2831673 RepID=UPI001F1D037A|nr:SDR family NAD(P)-dependent oxidoreductase [Virgibacillus sp. NKC19-16]UJL45728.1 SDR family oxidoreductase [Virgibacillus sp. NKC19-16]
MLLKDRIALVTGGASGLGREFCIQLANEGATTAILDVNKEGIEETRKLIAENGGEAISFELDITNSEQIDDVYQQIIERYGKIDILCNNAGVTGEGLTPVAELTEEGWDQVLNVNLKGAFLMTKKAIPHMLEKGKGVIINTASDSAIIAGPPGAAYVASKHGIAGLTKQIAYDYGQKGIRAVAIAPGVTKTSLADNLEETIKPLHDYIMNSPAGRYASPYEIARLVVFLASDQADFIHGHTIPIDGGASIQ